MVLLALPPEYLQILKIWHMQHSYKLINLANGNGHPTFKTPMLVRSRKQSNVGPGQYFYRYAGKDWGVYAEPRKSWFVILVCRRNLAYSFSCIYVWETRVTDALEIMGGVGIFQNFCSPQVSLDYRDRLKSWYVVWWNLFLLARQGQEQISPNHVPIL